MLESPHMDDSNTYPNHMFTEVLNTIFLYISDQLSLLVQRFHARQITIITKYVVVSSVGKTYILYYVLTRII